MSHNISKEGLAAKAIAIHDLVKPELPIAAGICVVAGEIIASENLPTIFSGLMGFLVGFFISGVAMITNDYFDLDVDRINRPERPFPSGRISSFELIALALLFSIAGFLAAASLGSHVLIIAIAMWIVSNLYNWRYKETGLLGNMIVGFCLSMLFICGGAAVGGLEKGIVWIFGALVFVFDLGEEIANGALDMEGDEKRSVRSVARIYGKKHALRVSGFLFALFILISFLPFALGWLGIVYLIIFVPMDLAILYFVTKLIASETIQDGRARVRQLYLSTMFFIVAFIIAFIGIRAS